MFCDSDHHAVIDKLFGQLPFAVQTTPATDHQDFNSIADVMVSFDGQPLVPMGLKHRGGNGRTDYNLSAWSASTGLLPEFANAGEKIYLYWMPNDEHVLIRFTNQEKLNELLPDEDQWKRATRIMEAYNDAYRAIPNNRNAWVRNESPNGKTTSQGVIFVPSTEEYVEELARWDAKMELIRHSFGMAVS